MRFVQAVTLVTGWVVEGLWQIEPLVVLFLAVKRAAADPVRSPDAMGCYPVGWRFLVLSLRLTHLEKNRTCCHGYVGYLRKRIVLQMAKISVVNKTLRR